MPHFKIFPALIATLSFASCGPAPSKPSTPQARQEVSISDSIADLIPLVTKHQEIEASRNALLLADSEGDLTAAMQSLEARSVAFTVKVTSVERSYVNISLDASRIEWPGFFRLIVPLPYYDGTSIPPKIHHHHIYPEGYAARSDGGISLSIPADESFLRTLRKDDKILLSGQITPSVCRITPAHGLSGKLVMTNLKVER